VEEVKQFEGDGLQPVRKTINVSGFSHGGTEAPPLRTEK
jgi:hypothetical protein